MIVSYMLIQLGIFFLAYIKYIQFDLTEFN